LGRVVSINVSEKKGVRKAPVGEIAVHAEWGIEGDAHASGSWHRQISLLAMESIRKSRAKGFNVGPGDFAENITTEGIDLLELIPGTRVALGEEIEVEISQIGKTCHTKCEIFRLAGDCVMPREGVFARVLKGGKLRVGDAVRVLK
jgi:MOSC domain-containing protein YiiM